MIPFKFLVIFLDDLSEIKFVQQALISRWWISSFGESNVPSLPEASL